MNKFEELEVIEYKVVQQNNDYDLNVILLKSKNLISWLRV